MQGAGLYLHIPYCVVRCTYCDFYSQVGAEEGSGRFFAALQKDLRTFPERHRYHPPVATVFFGGGTPSHAPPEAIAATLDTIREVFSLGPDAEITLEANPESVDAARLEMWREAGINRLSFGIQSLRPELLSLMGRPHGAEQAMAALRLARSAAFENISGDFIFGLPGQTAESWGEDLERIGGMGLDHISCYLLETDKPTPMSRAIASGQLAEPDAGTVAAQFEATAIALARHGYRRYEISNFCRPGRECRHNMGYWEDGPWLGFGPSAHGSWEGRRTEVPLTAEAYSATVEQGEEPLRVHPPGSSAERSAEALITGLRLEYGVDLSVLSRRYGLDLERRHAAAIETEIRRGRLVREGPRLRLTPGGVLFSNDVLCRFV